MIRRSRATPDENWQEVLDRRGCPRGDKRRSHIPSSFLKTGAPADAPVVHARKKTREFQRPARRGRRRAVPPLDTFERISAMERNVAPQACRQPPLPPGAHDEIRKQHHPREILTHRRKNLSSVRRPHRQRGSPAAPLAIHIAERHSRTPPRANPRTRPSGPARPSQSSIRTAIRPHHRAKCEREVSARRSLARDVFMAPVVRPILYGFFRLRHLFLTRAFNHR